MVIWIVPPPPSRWARLVDRWRRWKNRKRGGIPKGYRPLGMIEDTDA